LGGGGKDFNEYYIILTYKNCLPNYLNEFKDRVLVAMMGFAGRPYFERRLAHPERATSRLSPPLVSRYQSPCDQLVPERGGITPRIVVQLQQYG
jgi:hypothetical protein